MKMLRISYRHPFVLTLNGPHGRERLVIRNKYPDTDLSRTLFQNLGLMHLIAPYLPEEIATDFKVHPAFVKLINRLYLSKEQPPPVFINPDRHVKRFSAPRVSRNKVVVSYSSGKDSIWNKWRADKRYGGENVLPVHIAGLNKHNAPAERRAALWQAEELGFANFEMIDLLNSSVNNGYQVMRSRDMLIVALCVPLALEFGASKILIEGFAETGPTEPFTGQEKNMRMFNSLLASLGIPVEAAWYTRTEMNVIKDLIYEKPKWLAAANSCFARPDRGHKWAASWTRRAPTFPLFKFQCGSCVKCRLTNIARIHYDKNIPTVASVEDIRTYITETLKWRKENYKRLRDMIDGSFKESLRVVAKRYGVPFTSVG